MLSRCAEVLGKTGSCCGKYDCAQKLLSAVHSSSSFFHKSFGSACWVQLICHVYPGLLQDFLFGLVVYTESVPDEKLLLWNQSSQTFPLSSFRAFSFDTDPHRLWPLWPGSRAPKVLLRKRLQILLSALTQLIKIYPLCSQPQKHFLHPLSLNKHSPWWCVALVRACL